MTDQELKQLIDDKIYENKKGEITATVINELLKDIVDFANKTSFEQLNINIANVDICNATSCNGTNLTYTNGNITNLITYNIKTNKIYTDNNNYIEINKNGIKLQVINDIILQCDNYIFLNQDIKYKEGSYFYFSNDETNYIQYNNDKINIVGDVEFVNDIKLDNKIYFDNKNYIQFTNNEINIIGNIRLEKFKIYSYPDENNDWTTNLIADKSLYIKSNEDLTFSSIDHIDIKLNNLSILSVNTFNTTLKSGSTTTYQSYIEINSRSAATSAGMIKIESLNGIVLCSGNKRITLDDTKMQKLIDLLS